MGEQHLPPAGGVNIASCWHQPAHGPGRWAMGNNYTMRHVTYKEQHAGRVVVVVRPERVVRATHKVGWWWW